jgi:BASS family bile acid:Na+ symporter
MGMRLATLIPLVLQASIVLNVIGIGLNAGAQDATSLLRRPPQLLRSLCAMHVVMLACAVALAVNFDPHRAVKIALVALAVSPIPPLLPKKTLKAGGEASYAIGLLVVVALLAIVFVPVAVELLGRAVGTPTHMSPSAVARLVLLTVLVPLVVGMAIRSLAAAFAARIARPVSVNVAPPSGEVRWTNRVARAACSAVVVKTSHMARATCGMVVMGKLLLSALCGVWQPHNATGASLRFA